MLKQLFAVSVCLLFLAASAAPSIAQTEQPSAGKPAEKQAPAAKPAAKAKTATGKVKSVAADSLVIEAGKKDLAFVIGGAVAESAQKLKAGDTATVTYIESGGVMTATTIKAKAAKTAKQPTQPCAAQKK
jgi:hypothetical protein